MRSIATLFIFIVLAISGQSCILHQEEIKSPPTVLLEPMHKIIWIDSSFSREETNQIISAYQTIECSTNHSIVTFDIRPNININDLNINRTVSNILVISTNSGDPRIIASDRRLRVGGKRKYTVGLYLSHIEIPTVLLTRDRLDPTTFYRVALHEAIHSSMNILTHSKHKDSIMFPSIDGESATELSNNDLRFICEKYYCGNSTLRICKKGV